MTRYEYIFGAGTQMSKKEGRINVDIKSFANIDIVHNLDVFPYPFADSSGLHINATHVIEHLNNIPAFMDECWRILSPGGTLYIEVPHAANINLAFTDPTHKRFFTKHSFINYFTIEGVKKFGYSLHCWSILHIEEKEGCVIVHLMPIPDEMTDNEILLRLNDL